MLGIDNKITRTYSDFGLQSFLELTKLLIIPIIIHSLYSRLDSCRDRANQMVSHLQQPRRLSDSIWCSNSYARSIHLLETCLDYIRELDLPDCIVHGMLGDLFVCCEHVMLKPDWAPCTLPRKASIVTPAARAVCGSLTNKNGSRLANFHPRGWCWY